MDKPFRGNATSFTMTRQPKSGRAGRTIIKRPPATRGEPSNPYSLSSVNPNRVLDMRTLLRADDLRLIAIGKSCRTVTLRALANDRHLSVVLEDRTEAAAIVACDQYASGAREWAADLPDYGIQLEADGRLSGIDAPKAQEPAPQLHLGAANGLHVRCVVSAVVEVQLAASGDDEADKRLRLGVLDDDASRASRLAHLADCIMDAIADSGLLEIEPPAPEPPARRDELPADRLAKYRPGIRTN